MSTILPGRTVWHVPAPAHWLTRKQVLVLTIVLMTGSGVWLAAKSRRHREDAPAAQIATVSLTTTAAAAPAGEDQALSMCSEMLKRAQQLLAATPAIQAQFRKQERIDGTLQPQHVMDLKVRREPLSVYMRWQEPDPGQEILWQEGAHENQLLVHPGGWKGKLLPMVKLDPQGERAMEANRRPVMSVGPWKMTQRLLDYLAECEGDRDNVRVAMNEEAKIGDADCYCFRFTHQQPEEGLEFKEVVIYVDKQHSLPIAVQNYGWPTETSQGQPTLEESYVFEQINLHPELTDQDFSHTNPSYAFGAQ